MRILIADDSEALVQRLRARLTEVEGVDDVAQAGSVPAAELEIRTAKPDVLILDIQMPGGSGISVLERLKGIPTKPAVIVLTNCGDRRYRTRCLASGARYFFDKSTEFHKVVEAVRSLMGATRE